MRGRRVAVLIPHMIEDVLLVLPCAAPQHIAEPTTPPVIDQFRKLLITTMIHPTNLERISRDDATWRKHNGQALDSTGVPACYGARLLDLLDGECRHLVSVMPLAPTCRRG